MRGEEGGTVYWLWKRKKAGQSRFSSKRREGNGTHFLP